MHRFTDLATPHVLAASNIFDRFFQWGAHLPPTGLYLFVFAWLFIESTGFPISDEPLLLLAGYLSTTGRVSLALVIIVALVGKVAASCVAFWLGHYLDFERLARPTTQPATGAGRWLWHLRPTKAAVMATEDRVRRQGGWGVFLGRLVPVVRSFISYPAGALRMPFPIFLGATTAGSLLWIAIWTVLGAVLGKSYDVAFRKWGAASPFVLIGLVLVLVIVYIWNHRRAEAAALRAQAQRVAEAAHHVRHPHANTSKSATVKPGTTPSRPASAPTPKAKLAATKARKR
ncbi:MAG: DedA family protein [Ktedonobacteraceae bacterium]|nr:DedA family protein [Ktedonobacteraceae bacterium]